MYTLTTKYQLPHDLVFHVSFIGQISHFVSPSVRKRTSIWSSYQQTKDGFYAKKDYQKNDLNGNTTIQLINKVYNITSNHIRPNGGATQGLLAIGQSYNVTDLITYSDRYHLSKPYSNITTSLKSKGHNFPFECTHDPNQCLEASLDLETINSVASGGQTIFWNADPNSQMWFTDYIIYLVNNIHSPLMNSFSYDIIESTWSGDLKDRFSMNAMKLGVRGITVLTASGDDGVAGYSTRNHGVGTCKYFFLFLVVVVSKLFIYCYIFVFCIF